MNRYFARPTEEVIAQADAILEADNSGYIVKYIMSGYAQKSVANAQELMRYSNELADAAFERCSDRIQQLSQATSMLVFQQWVEKNDPKNRDALFSIMLPVCKAIFPGGHVKGESKADHEYFEKFLELMKDKKVFDMEKDAKWLKTWGYTEYIEKVEAAEKGSSNEDDF